MSDEWEEWQLEWDNYFDDIEDTLKLMDALAERAEREGLEELAVTLVEAGTALIRHTRVCDEFLAAQRLRVTSEIYARNPLLKMLMEKAKGGLSDG
jgi:hypothetical protein